MKKSSFIYVGFFLVFIFGLTNFAVAQPTTPVVGKDAANKYFKPKQAPVAEREFPTNHYLALHLGTYLDSAAYVWGPERKVNKPGKSSLGLTYLIGEWTGSMDLNFRVDFNTFELDEQRLTKMSIMPLITFPEVGAKFPLYFGAGVGVGAFFKQISSESSLSVDYQLVAGARLLNLFERTGFFIETGLKNHLHLLSDGQFNGVFLAAGAVFTF